MGVLLAGSLRKDRPVHAQVWEAWDSAVEAACAAVYAARRAGDTTEENRARRRWRELVRLGNLEVVR